MAIPHSLQWEIDQIPRNSEITHGTGLSRFAVDGIEPRAAVFPKHHGGSEPLALGCGLGLRLFHLNARRAFLSKSAVVPSVRGQSGASVSVHSGVQPWELPSPVMPAQGGQALVAAERAGQADQDGRPAWCGTPGD